MLEFLEMECLIYIVGFDQPSSSLVVLYDQDTGRVVVGSGGTNRKPRY
jgi:hypothetical protein